MTKRNNERLNRNLVIQLLVNANSLVWQGLLSFVTAFNLFGSYVQNAQDAEATAKADIKGAAKDKKNKRQTMGVSAMHIRGAVQAFATATGNTDLFNTVNFSTSKILYGKSNEALSICQVIYNSAQANLAALANYGVTAPVLQSFLDSMDAYQAVISAPVDAKATRKIANRQVSQYLDQATAVLDDSLTNLMENFRTTAPVFYAKFMSEKQLIHGATHFTELDALIKNAVTKEPMFGVEMLIVNPLQSYTVTSDVFGIADKKSMKASLYDVTFNCPGFVSKTIQDVDMTKSEHKSLAVELVPLS